MKFINSRSWLFTILHSLSKIIVTPFSAVYVSHFGSTPSTLGLPVFTKFIHAELILSANAQASSALPVQSALRSTVLNAKGMSKPWKEPLEALSTGLFQVKRYTYNGALDSEALASAVRI